MATDIGKFAVVCVAAAILVLAAVGGGPLMRLLDQNLLHESLKDGWGQLWHDEDWSVAATLPSTLDNAWLLKAPRPVLVAHALGEAGQPAQNTLAAMQRTLERGIRLLEVDLWLDDRGILRCHHGPGRPAPFQTGDCTLPLAAKLALQHEAWLVLDIKTDFRSTGQAIARQMAGSPAASRLVFQLYRPDEAALFVEWSSRLSLPAPIVTAYVSHRSVDHLARHAARIGVQALTVPLPRAAALGEVPASLTLLVHPVHDCNDIRKAARTAAQGMYVRSSLVSMGRLQCVE